MYQYNTPWIKIRSQDHTSCSPTISELRHNLLSNLYPKTPHLYSKTPAHVKATLFRVSHKDRTL